VQGRAVCYQPIVMPPPSPLLAALGRDPDGLAFDVDGRELTWRQLDDASKCVAAGLVRLGVRPGDRVAWFGPASVELLELLVATLRIGAIYVPINSRYQASETAHILADAAPALLVAAPGSVGHSTARAQFAALPLVLTGLTPFADAVPYRALGIPSLRPLPPPPAPEAVAMLVYTSGTTGPSKGVALTHAGLAANLDAVLGLWQVGPPDRMALALPLFHVHGLGLGVLGALMRGTTTLVASHFDPAWVVDAVHRRGATVFMGVPTMYARLLAHLDASPHDAPKLANARLFTSGSAALPASHHEAFARLTGHAVLERYGMTETGFTLSNPYAGERRAGSVGMAVPDVEVRLRDDADGPVAEGESGEIQVRGPGLLACYWGLPEATAASMTPDGFFRTGDIARVDADGYLHIVGRSSVDIIKSGGFKISAREIEEAILSHAGVAEAAVVGVPDLEWGERVAAALVLRPGADPDEVVDQLMGELIEKLAHFKTPRRFLVLDELPRNALGKLQKHRVREYFSED
jgi:acyl-CoA synthetase (AMP-forming)/AMP-acid ligase II